MDDGGTVVHYTGYALGVQLLCANCIYIFGIIPGVVGVQLLCATCCMRGMASVVSGSPIEQSRSSFVSTDAAATSVLYRS